MDKNYIKHTMSLIVVWTGGKAIKELHKITSMSKKDIKSWLAKQALWQVHIPPP